MNSNPLKTAFDKARKASEQREIVRGVIGRTDSDTPAQCVVADRPTFLYVRTAPGGNVGVTIARNPGNLSVRAATPVEMVRRNGNLVITGYDLSNSRFESATGGDSLNQYGVAPHTHKIGTGLEYEVESLRLEPGRVHSDSHTMTATVNGFRYWLDTFAGDTVDLTSHIPTSGKHRWVLVGVNPATNLIVVADGAEVITATPLSILDLDAISFAGYIPLGAFDVTFGDTELAQYSYEAREWLNMPPILFNDAEGNPAPVVTTTALDGTSTYAARRDHVHGITDDAVTFAKMQNIGTDTLIGRDTSGTGDPESITLGSGLQFSGAGVLQRAALTGDVGTATDSNTTVITTGAVTTTKILNDAVTNTKLDNMATKTYKGRTSSGTGDPEDVSVATLVADINSTIDHGALSGLADDDHTQYALVTGTRAFTGNITAPWLDYPLLDGTNGLNFNTGTTYPAGWTEVTAAYITGISAGFWHIQGNDANPAWKYKVQGAYTVETFTVYKSVMFGPIMISDRKLADDVTYYFGYYRNNAGVLDANTYVRFELWWDSANSLWKVRSAGKDGTSEVNGSWLSLDYPFFIQPLWLRVAIIDARTARVYMGMQQNPILHTFMDTLNLTASSTWGQAWVQVHMSRGATDGTVNHLYIGAIDFGNYD